MNLSAALETSFSLRAFHMRFSQWYLFLVHQSIDQQATWSWWEKGATYPSGLNLINIQRQKKLADSLHANPILVQLEVSHSILKQSHDHKKL